MATKLQAPATAGYNAIGKNQFKIVSVDEIIIDPEISKIFKIDEKLLEIITQSIIKDGYDESQPVTLQKGTNILADGHTRLQAAKNAGLTKIPSVYKEFASRDELLFYCYARQSKRRNLSSAEISAVAQLLINKKKAANGDGRTVDAFAEQFGIGASTLCEAKKVLNEGNPEIIAAVKSGKISNKRAVKMINEMKNPKEKQEKNLIKNNETREDILRYVFLKDAVSYLLKAEQIFASKLLITRFIHEEKYKVFFEMLPEDLRCQISDILPVILPVE